VPSVVGGGISINDLRKNLRDLNEHMDHECSSSEARYGIVLDASLITGIDPPPEVESALAAINTAHNMVSSDVILPKPPRSAHRAVEAGRRIETLKAQARSPTAGRSRQPARRAEGHRRRGVARLCAQCPPGLVRQRATGCYGDKAMIALAASIFATFLGASIVVPLIFWMLRLFGHLRGS